MSSVSLRGEPSRSQGDRPAPSLEERLAPKLDQAEYLLVLVLALMLWIAGFVDLFTHTSQDRTVLGLYSWPYFAFLGLYALGFAFWAALIFPARSLEWFKRGIHFFQSRPLPFAAWFAGSSALLASMFVWERWTGFPLLETSLAILVALLSAVLLFMKPYPAERARPFHRGAVYAVGLVLAAELLMQALAAGRALPVQNLHGLFTAYGRVYQNQEGFANGRMNKFGWYYPEFRMEPGSRRIVLLGDSFVQGLQVSKSELFGVLLEQRLNGPGAPEPVETFGFGLPGYGPGLYLNTPLYPYILEPVQPDEIVVFFHLANDFQALAGPEPGRLFFYVNPAGQVDVPPEHFYLRHDIQHLIIRGYEPINPVETFASHVFSLRPLISLAQRAGGKPLLDDLPALNFEQSGPQQPFGAASFIFSPEASPQAEAAWALAEGALDEFTRHAAAQGVTVRLVTIPHFPEPFYAAQPSQGWTAALGQYDALLPEKRLEAFAQARGIPFLGLGETLRSEGYSLEQVRALFLKDGAGHFSPAGHAFVAQALADYFYQPDGR